VENDSLFTVRYILILCLLVAYYKQLQGYFLCAHAVVVQALQNLDIMYVFVEVNVSSIYLSQYQKDTWNMSVILMP